MTAAPPVRAFTALTFLSVLPLGLFVAYVLALTARGFSPVTIATLLAALALTTAVLELPTGGLADVVGRRPVLLAAAVCSGAALVIMAVAASPGWHLVGVVAFGAGKALRSGPLESWFVDAVHRDMPPAAHDHAISRGLGRAGAATGIAAALGAVGGGLLADASTGLGLPATGQAPVIGLSTPLLLAAAVTVVQAGAVLRWVREEQRPRIALREVMTSVPVTVASGFALIATTPVLRWFSVRWCILPVGFLAFELVTPVALVDALDDPGRAASVFGVVVAVCLVGGAVTAPLAGVLGRRFGRLTASAACTVLAGLSFMLAGWGGVAGLVLAVVLANVVIGPVNALNGPILHGAVDARRRVTLLSVESLVQHVCIALGAVVLGVVVSGAGTGLAFVLAGALTAAAAIPLWGVARALRSAATE